MRAPNPAPEDALRVAGLLGHQQAERPCAGRPTVTPCGSTASRRRASSRRRTARAADRHRGHRRRRPVDPRRPAEGVARGARIRRRQHRPAPLGSWPGRGIERAKRGNTLDPLTLNLLYATDFWDRMERQILPALRAGMVALVDRYIFSLMSRALGARPVRRVGREPVRLRAGARPGRLPGHRRRASGATRAEHDRLRLLGVRPGLSARARTSFRTSSSTRRGCWPSFAAWRRTRVYDRRRARTDPRVFQALCGVIEPVVQDMATFEGLDGVSDPLKMLSS